LLQVTNVQFTDFNWRTWIRNILVIEIINNYVVNRLIRDEIDAGIPSNRIVIGGFSQGSATAITAGLSSEYPLAGIIG